MVSHIFYLFLYAFAADQQAFGQIPLHVSLIAHLPMKNNHCPNTVTALVDATNLWPFACLYSRRPGLTEVVRSCGGQGSGKGVCDNERTGVYSMVSMTTIHSRKQRGAYRKRPGHFKRYFSHRQGREDIQRSMVHRYASPTNILDSLMQRFLIRGRLM